MPVLHLDDLQVRLNTALGIEELRQFANGHAMPDGKRMVSGKRQLVGIRERAFNHFSVDRIYPVEHDKSDFVLRGFLHRQAQRGDIGVEPRADVLNVKDERVDSFEHSGCWFSCVAVEAVDRRACFLIY